MSKIQQAAASILSIMLALSSIPVNGVQAAETEGHIIINQIYGGGGKGDTPISHSFIELYNPTDADISLEGYTITYSSNRENPKEKHQGSTWQSDGTVQTVTLELTGIIASQHSYLIRCAAEDTSNPAVTLTQADTDWNQVIDNDLSVELILYADGARVDGISTRETDFCDIGEGSAPAASSISKQKSLRRIDFSDTDHNAADFQVVVWNDLPADAEAAAAYITAYSPRSSADGIWTDNSDTTETEPVQPDVPETTVSGTDSTETQVPETESPKTDSADTDTPSQESAIRNTGFENGTAVALEKLGSYISGVSNKDGGVAEIVSYDTAENTAWVVNGTTGMLDKISLSPVTDKTSQTLTAVSLDIKALAAEKAPWFNYGDMTSVSVCSDLGLVAVALQDASYDQNGYVALLKTDGTLCAMLEAGCQPDMVKFTPDGTRILAANEGEPREGIGAGITDPKGSVTIVTVNSTQPEASTSETILFDAYDSRRAELTAAGIILTKDTMPSVDLEPEYIDCDNTTAYIALQEANAIAVLDLNAKTFTGIYSLGYKDFSLPENAVDLTDDGTYTPKNYSALSAYMPDGISIYQTGGCTYILTANEGDAREWGSGDAEYVNEIKTTLTATDGTLAKKVRIIDASVTDGLPADTAVLFGGRSFSIYRVDASGVTQVFDSSNDFEAKTAAYLPAYFNCSNDDNEYDSRSQKKGPEPETVTIGTVEGRTYAFVGLERIGGIMMYDITDPQAVTYCNYINTRDFSEDPENADPSDNPGFYLNSDIAPEGMYFISSAHSPSGTPILLTAFEVSGTVTAYAVGTVPTGDTTEAGDSSDDTTGEEDSSTDSDTDSDADHDTDLDGSPSENEAPPTGDSSPLMLWSFLASMGIMGAAAAGCFRRKKHEK